MLLLQKEPQNALVLINTLLSELKKLDDKQMLTEVHLTESKIHHALRNIPKGKYLPFNANNFHIGSLVI